MHSTAAEARRLEAVQKNKDVWGLTWSDVGISFATLLLAVSL